MNIRKLKELIGKALTKDFKRAIMIWGGPGIGKSCGVKQVCTEHDAGFCDLRLAQCDPTDLRGVLVYSPQTDKGRWVHPNSLPNGDAKKRGILFLDEINLAPPSVQAAAYQLVLDRKVGDYVLPDGWMVVAAGNRAEDSALVQDMPPPLLNRFVQVDAEADFDVFKDYALRSGFHPFVTGFLNWKKEYLYTAPEASVKAFATPRSWEALSDVLKTFDMETEVVIGTIGRGVGTEFVAFAELASVLEPTIDGILKGNYTLPKEDHYVFFIFSALASKIRENKDYAVQHYGYIDYLTTQSRKVLAAVGYSDVAKSFPEAYRHFKKQTPDVFKRLVATLGKLVQSAILDAEVK